ncbi:hypothetical protein, partial [Mycobacterium tuberculosis]|uniref:hypothetical protein n=1 Tax=Mycobacterium tuberculosis TaxID=1773 RepID=UPI001AE4EAE9
IATTDPSPATLTVADWTTGAADSNITIDLGDAASGLTQLSDDDGTLSVSLDQEQDGVGYGTLSGVSIAEDGTVSASY